MKPIIQLEQRLIDKIAAGEVVERPLSVVKELTENAIDAGAGIVTVEIADGGLTMIRVTDNGVGIPAEQLDLAFSRHATSKIASADDLFAVGTLGFRGEALSSIAAVAQVEMITKPQLAITGTRFELHGGRYVDKREVGCPNGTTVIVSNLFYNVPVRRKFLKKPATEAGYISDCLQKLALGNPRLCIRYISNGQLVFQTNGNGDLRTALLNVYGREAAAKVMDVTADAPPLRLHGLLGKPETARGNRAHGTFFINGRYIQSKLLSSAVESAFKTLLPAGKFPLYVLHLTLPPDALDVNVHPTKMDVRFADEAGVCAFIQEALEKVLGANSLTPEIRLGDHRAKETPADIGQIDLPLYQPMQTLPAAANTHTVREFDPASLPAATQAEAPPPIEFSPAPATPLFPAYQILGLAFDTYWLVAQGESLLLIDQHAAHERILYEEILRSTDAAPTMAQPLLAPNPLHLTLREQQTLRDHAEYFTRLGFGLQFDPETALTAVPLLFKGPALGGFFMEILDQLADNLSAEEKYKTEMIAVAACKAAVKAGDRLSQDEARTLIERLLKLDNPFTCPHGRPTMIEITRRELERRFKRG